MNHELLPPPANDQHAAHGLSASRCWAPSAWLCREVSGSEYLLYLGGEEAKPTRLQRPGRADAWTWGNGFENVVIFTPREWAKISPVTLEPGDGPVAVCGGFFLPNVVMSDAPCTVRPLSGCAMPTPNVAVREPEDGSRHPL